MTAADPYGRRREQVARANRAAAAQPRRGHDYRASEFWNADEALRLLDKTLAEVYRDDD